jgi:hypothetical protein
VSYYDEQIRRAKIVRWARAAMAVAFAGEVISSVLNALAGNARESCTDLAAAVFIALAMRFQTVVIRRIEATAGRPDYAAIARLEREIYGEGHKHSP